ncbi:hypothetical protein VdG2_07843 [Verticillium dahliae VDG2]|nr:hypothetical protein VdG2_07843 [Verticillium dahliae VDG2]
MASGDIVDYEAVMVDEFDALNIEVRVSGGPSSSVPGAALSAPQCPGMRALPQKGPVLSTPVPTTAPPPTPLAVDNMVIQKETTKYPAKLHAAKVADELKASSGLVFLPGEPSRTYEYSDMGPAFHQRRYFFYLAGVNVPDCAVTYSLADDRLTVWIPHVEPRKVLYNGRVPSIKDVLAASDVDEVRHMQHLPAFLHAYAHQHDKATIYLIDASQSHPALVDNARIHIDSAALRPAMDEARVTKTAHEIALIRKANAVSSAAHRAVMRHIRRFASERQVAALFTAECTVRGAPTQAYAPIAGSGPNAATLHYGANDEPLAGRHTHDVTGRDRLLLAAGAREPRAKREGVSAETLVGLVGLAAAATTTTTTTGPPYRGKQTLRPGMVVTVEPGLYFNKDYIEGYFLREDRHRAFIDRDVLARYYPVGGVRIEDCILVTHDGHENLTDAPKGEDMLRIIRGEAP